MEPTEVAPSAEDLLNELTQLRAQLSEYQRLASFPQQSPIPVFEFNRQGKAVFLNPTAQVLLAELGQLDAGCFLPENYAEVSDSDGKNERVESSRRVSINGRTFDERIHYSKEFDTLRVYAYDITRHVQVEGAQREDEARYRAIFEAMTEGFAIHEVIYDTEGQARDYRFLEINPAFERLTGLKRNDVIGKTYNEILPGEGDSWLKTYEWVVESGEPVQFENYSPSLRKYYEVYAYRCAPGQFAAIFMDITDRRLLEERQRISLTKYAVLFDAFPLGITVSDVNGRIIESNLEAADLLGLSEEEQNRRKIDGVEWQIIHPDGTPMPVEEYASVRALKEQRRIDNVEMGVVDENGQVTWISVTAAPLPLENYGVVITYNDITKRVEAEEALRQAHEKLELTVQQRTGELVAANNELRMEISERKRVESELILQTRAVDAQRQRFNDVLEILPAYLILLTADYHVAFANRYFRERFGEDKGRQCFEYLFGRSFPCENCETYTVMKSCASHNWEWTGPDDHVYNVYDFPFTDVDGSTLILEMGIDVTEHKMAEEALRKSEEQYRSLTMATSQIVWQTNAEGEVTEHIPMWAAYTGQSPTETLGRGWINALHPEDQQRTGDTWAQAVATHTPYHTEYRIRSRSGEYGHFSVRGVPLKDAAGNITGWIGTCTDITDKKNYENQLVQAEKHAAIGRMVGSVTHEINNPLQTIKNCLYLIRQDTDAESPNLEPLEMALSETQRLSNIVGQLRQLYRPQPAQMLKSHDLLDMIHEVNALINTHLVHSHVTWQSLPGLRSCHVDCYHDQVIEVLLNLCINAIEAMKEEGGVLSVNMVTSSDHQQVGVVISDTGPGINPEILPHIFEPFVTTKEFGLGLGLSICYGIVQKHGGQITVDSQPGQGSSFTMWLPVSM